jgi:LysR family transcriptional regulator (chromosome initiation inhibitor)
MLRFDRRDGLQARWAREALGIEALDAPVHWVAAYNLVRLPKLLAVAA